MNLQLRLLTLLACLLLVACNPPLSKKNLLVIGDSNGVNEGWAHQLQQLRGGGEMTNTSLGGNTVGFTYGAGMKLNTLENLTGYLRRGYAEMGSIDEVLICLGTNDCKAQFADRRGEVTTGLNTMLDRIVAFFEDRGQDVPRIVILSPPPLNDVGAIEEFAGATACTRELTGSFRRIASERGYCFVDLQTKPGAAILADSPDGIHFEKAGYEQIAEAVLNACY